MLDALRHTGWRNYTLFTRSDGLLFGYFEAPESFKAALDGVAKESINERWQAFMQPYFEALGVDVRTSECWNWRKSSISTKPANSS